MRIRHVTGREGWFGLSLAGGRCVLIGLGSSVLLTLTQAHAATPFADGPGACIRVQVPNGKGLSSVELREGTPQAVDVPSKLKFRLTPSQECIAQFAGGSPENPKVLVVRTVVSSEFDKTTEDDDVQVRVYGVDHVRAQESFVLTSKHLRVEGTAFLRVQSRVVAQSESSTIIKGDDSPAPDEVTLNVIDGHLLKAFGYRTTIPLLYRLRQDDKPEKYALGVATSVLWYPLRHTRATGEWRSLSLELTAGATRGIIKTKEERAFFHAGVGASYRGVVGIGTAWDASRSEYFGLYLNLTVFSEKGLFGLVPVSD